MMELLYLPSPVGWLRLEAQDGALCGLCLAPGTPDAPGSGRDPVLALAAHQLEEYFAGQRRSFTVPLLLRGTPFQQKAWAALQQIPYGQTRTYAQQAAAIGDPRACRAVGMANHRNPVSIIVPCHRVIGANGSLVGYAGGLDAKRALLALEARYAGRR